MTLLQDARPTNFHDFYSPKSPLQSATASCTTERDTYYTECMCFASPNNKTAKHSVFVRRLSDRAVAPATNTLLVKASGYCSVTGIGAWDSYQEAVQALLEIGVQWFEQAAR